MAEDITGGINTMGKLMKYTAQTYEDKAAIKYIIDDKLYVKSYRKFYEDSLSVSAYIKGICSDRMHIALIAKTNYEFLTAFNAAMISGNIAVPFAPDIPVDEAVALLDDCDASFVITDFNSFKNEEEIFALCPKVKYVLSLADKEKFAEIYERKGIDEKYLETFDNDPDACTTIIYTSGTTGARKGAMLSSYAIMSNIFFKEFNFEGDHVALCVLPLHHIFCFSCDYLKNLKDGVTICLNLDKKKILNDFVTFEPSVVRLVPMIFDTMCRRVEVIRKKQPELSPREAAEKVFGRRLHSVIISGAAFSPESENEFVEMGLEVRQGYGMTETGPRVAVPNNTCIQSGGRVISICDVRISDGEIQVKSPSLMMGYYKRPEETAAVFTDDGYLKTGDLGRMTEDGELFITGRIKNIIILSNGENVSPEEIEKKYIIDPLVKEIVVYENNGSICADIYPDYEYAKKKGIDIEKEIDELVKRENAKDIAAHEIDKVNILKDPMPRTSTGKIIRKR